MSCRRENMRHEHAYDDERGLVVYIFSIRSLCFDTTYTIQYMDPCRVAKRNGGAQQSANTLSTIHGVNEMK